MAYNEVDFARFKKNELKPGDTFQFAWIGVQEVVERVIPDVKEPAQGKERADGRLVLLNQAPPLAKEPAATVLPICMCYVR